MIRLSLLALLAVVGIYIYGYHVGQSIATIADIGAIQLIDTQDSIQPSDGFQVLPSYQVQPAINVLR